MLDSDNVFQEFDLHNEEFDINDVVNRHGDIDQDITADDDEQPKSGETLGEKIDIRSLVSKKDIESEDIINYNDETRKKKDFQLEYNQTKDILDNEKRLQDNFKDYLLARKISGKKSFSQYKSRIPAELLSDLGDTVQIEDDPIFVEHSIEDSSTVIINRDDNDEVVSIDVICSCGRKTTIEFDYLNSSKLDVEKEKKDSLHDYEIENKEKESKQTEDPNNQDEKAIDLPEEAKLPNDSDDIDKLEKSSEEIEDNSKDENSNSNNNSESINEE